MFSQPRRLATRRGESPLLKYRAILLQKTLNSHSAAQKIEQLRLFSCQWFKWWKGANGFPKANLRCVFKLAVEFQETDKYLQCARAHVHISVLRWAWTPREQYSVPTSDGDMDILQLTRIKLVQVHFGLEVWRDTRAAVSWWRQTARLRRAGSWGQR
jgi:hypothetical protein